MARTLRWNGSSASGRVARSGSPIQEDVQRRIRLVAGLDPGEVRHQEESLRHPVSRPEWVHS